jgi:NADPH:quinone reductase-like Zn-dependent oxidoreductase
MDRKVRVLIKTLNRHCSRSDSNLPHGATGAFQRFVIVNAQAVAELPYKIPSSVGVVLPLGISTASAGLYQKSYLSLPFPTVENPKPIHRTLLIWGGSSSVGSCAIQLAVASGVDVITTASKKNFEYCKDLGAEKVFDYHDEDVEAQIGKYLDGKTLAGVFHAVGANGAVETCARIAEKAEGKAVVVTVRGVPEEGIPGEVRVKASK